MRRFLAGVLCAALFLQPASAAKVKTAPGIPSLPAMTIPLVSVSPVSSVVPSAAAAAPSASEAMPRTGERIRFPRAASLIMGRSKFHALGLAQLKARAAELKKLMEDERTSEATLAAFHEAKKGIGAFADLKHGRLKLAHALIRAQATLDKAAACAKKDHVGHDEPTSTRASAGPRRPAALMVSKAVEAVMKEKDLAYIHDQGRLVEALDALTASLDAPANAEALLGNISLRKHVAAMAEAFPDSHARAEVGERARLFQAKIDINEFGVGQLITYRDRFGGFDFLFGSLGTVGIALGVYSFAFERFSSPYYWTAAGVLSFFFGILAQGYRGDTYDERIRLLPKNIPLKHPRPLPPGPPPDSILK